GGTTARRRGRAVATDCLERVRIRIAKEIQQKLWPVAQFASHEFYASSVVITSIHTLIYSDDANATRAFLRDVLGWKYVAEDFDNAWLIFKSGPSEMGV